MLRHPHAKSGRALEMTAGARVGRNKSLQFRHEYNRTPELPGRPAVFFLARPYMLCHRPVVWASLIG